MASLHPYTQLKEKRFIAYILTLMRNGLSWRKLPSNKRKWLFGAFSRTEESSKTHGEVDT